ncbi:MAG: CoF synthetase [Nitrospira bacterium HGW-Nitrospira-1]|nr:MAG: CoF synthetase [Nitrospira bacterium HGW-Nitrospira-1]
MKKFSPLYRGLEFSGTEEIKDAQEKLFSDHLRCLVSNSPYYRRTLSGIDIDNTGLDHLYELPFTEKAHFEKCCDDFLAVPFSKIVDIVFSSGTTGAPTRIMYTENDLKRLAYNEEISLAGCGISAEDIALLTCTLDRCFIAGLAYFLGTRNLGAAAVRNGLNSVASHLETMLRVNPTVIVGVPSFLLKLGQYLVSKGIEPRGIGVSKLICIGEPIRDKDMSLLKMGAHLEDIWGAKVFSTYASSETITSFCECEMQAGGHLHPDLAVVEIVDDMGKVLPCGKTGEVVVTPLSIEGMPLLRFKTGDVSFLIDEPCSCGRFSPRLGPIIGRKKQMIKYRGTTLYPQAIYSVLAEIPGISEYYITLSSDYDLSDQIRICVSVGNSACSAESIATELQARLRVCPEVVIASEEQVRAQVYSGNSRKLVRLIDRREKNGEL